MPFRNRRDRRVLSGQFWDQPVESSRFIDGLGRLSPGEAPPSAVLSPSGLSRSQQLVALKAAGFPAAVSYCGDQGGWVVDRVVAQHGSSTAWLVVTARVKLQKLLSSAQSSAPQSQLGVVRDLDNYAFCWRSRLVLGRRTTFNVVAELNNVKNALLALRRQPPTATHAARGPTVRAVLRHKMGRHEVLATTTWNDERLRHDGGVEPIPFSSSVDIATAQPHSWLQYRAGLHEARCSDVSETGSTHAVHVQAGAAARKAWVLWQPSAARGRNNDDKFASEDGWQPPSWRSVGQPSAQRRATQARNAPQTPSHATKDSTAHAAHQHHAVPVQSHISVHQPPAVTSAAGGKAAADGGGATADPLRSALRDLSQTLSAAQDVVSALPTAAALKSGIATAARSVEQLQSAAHTATAGVNAGDLQSRLLGSTARQQPRKLPYNFALATRHVTLHAEVAGVVRVPFSSDDARDDGIAHARGGANSGDHDDVLLWTSPVDRMLARAKRVQMRGAATFGISSCFGRFRRRWLDHFTFDAQLHVGLLRCHAAQRAAVPPLRVRSSMIDSPDDDDAVDDIIPVAADVVPRVARHALTTTAGMQLWGPLRAVSEHTYALPGEHGSPAWLQSSTFALEYSLPGGLARATLWYCPQRKEGMLGLRL